MKKKIRVRYALVNEDGSPATWCHQEVVKMLAVSVIGEPEVVIQARGSVLFAIMYCGTMP